MKLKLLVIAALVVCRRCGRLRLGRSAACRSPATPTRPSTSPRPRRPATSPTSVAATGTVAATLRSTTSASGPRRSSRRTRSSDQLGFRRRWWRVTEVVGVKVGDQTVKAGEVLAKASTADLEAQIADGAAALASRRRSSSARRTQALTNASGTDAIRQAQDRPLYNAHNGKRQAQQSVDDLHKQIELRRR